MSIPIKSRAEFQRLSDTRLAEAKALLDIGMWAGSYYLAGYSVECALKACIAKLMVAEEFPDKEFAVKCYTHNFETLFTQAGLKNAWDSAVILEPKLSNNWTFVRVWSESKRYHWIVEAEAKALYSAVEDPTYGVQKWIKTYW